MSTITLPSIDWTNPNVLSQIMENIRNPLSKIMENSKSNGNALDLQNEVIFSSSKQIHDVVEHILEEIKSKSVSLTVKQNPDIFEIYDTNKNVQTICSEKIIPSKITKTDKDWLINLETEVYRSIKQNDISIYDLSYKLAVSERQLYRKTTDLIHLTPNKYIRVLRLHKAKEMIENYVQHSISQLSYAIGYNDVHYFSKLFFDQYNVTPRDMISSLK